MTASYINLIKMFHSECINSCVKSSLSQASWGLLMPCFVNNKSNKKVFFTSAFVILRLKIKFYLIINSNLIHINKIQSNNPNIEILKICLRKQSSNNNPIPYILQSFKIFKYDSLIKLIWIFWNTVEEKLPYHKYVPNTF